jgi:hypothetical protein
MSVDIFKVEPDHMETLLATGVDSAEIDGLRDWFAYTKPIAASMEIVARTISGEETIFRLVTTGTEYNPSEPSA